MSERDVASGQTYPLFTQTGLVTATGILSGFPLITRLSAPPACDHNTKETNITSLNQMIGRTNKHPKN